MKQLTSLRPHRQLLPLLLAALLSISHVHAAPGPYGELADARSMGDTGIHDFFAKIVLTKN